MRKFSLILFFVYITVFSLYHFVFAVNPVSPFSPGENIQDPDCLPTDSNCYVTFAMPSLAAPTVDYNGEIAYDTTVDDFTTGIIRFYGTEEQGIVAMPIAEFTAPTDGQVISYNATNDEFELVTISAGATTLDGLTDCETDYATDDNMFCGSGAGASIASGGVRNLAFGEGALNALTTGDDNLAIGYNALTLNTGINNLAVGSMALDANTSGLQNLAIGLSALGANQTGDNNLAIGLNALLLNTVSNNFAIGSGALDSNTSGTPNLAIGLNALGANQTGTHNLAIGSQALLLNTGSSNLAIGPGALDANTSGTHNLAIGVDALGANQTGGVNIAIGYQALLLNTGGPNIAIGANALDSNTSGSQNLAIGQNALSSNQTGINSIAIGHNALMNSTVSYNLALGPQALDLNTTGTPNIAIGYDALGANQTGSNNIAIGYESLLLSTAGTNLSIGHNAGNSITTGTGNILIGNSVDTTAAGASNELNIGNTLYGDLTNSEIGIQNSNPAVALHVGSASTADTTTLLRLEDANSTCNFTADAGAPTCGSDRRLKTDIEDLDTSEILNKLTSLDTVSYRWKTDDEDAPLQYGFIAQNVQDYFPNLVTEGTWVDGSEKLFLSMGGLMPYTVASIKELNLKLNDIENFEEEGNTFGNRLRVWLGNITNGIERIFVKEVKTEKLCLGETCITEEDLKELLLENNINQNYTTGGNGGIEDTNEDENIENGEVVEENTVEDENVIIEEPEGEEEAPEEEIINEEILEENNESEEIINQEEQTNEENESSN